MPANTTPEIVQRGGAKVCTNLLLFRLPRCSMPAHKIQLHTLVSDVTQ